MSDVFDVKSVHIPLLGTLGTAFHPLIHFPASGGCITLLEAQLYNGTLMIVGTLNLLRGTAANGGTFVPLATIGTSYGTGGGTFPAVKLVDITISDPTVPAGNWLALACSGAFTAAGETFVTMAYVMGRP